MNIRKLEDLSKDELIDLIKHEREACGQLVPISVDERLPERRKDSNRWSYYVISYNKRNKTFIAFYDYEYSEWHDNDGEVISDVTHWLPIPEIEK